MAAIDAYAIVGGTTDFDTSNPASGEYINIEIGVKVVAMDRSDFRTDSIKLNVSIHDSDNMRRKKIVDHVRAWANALSPMNGNDEFHLVFVMFQDFTSYRVLQDMVFRNTIDPLAL